MNKIFCFLLIYIITLSCNIYNKKEFYTGYVYDYNPQNEMYQFFKTKCTFFERWLSVAKVIKKTRICGIAIRVFYVLCLYNLSGNISKSGL